AKSGKEAKDPEADYLATIYFLEDGKRTGFPAVGFKSAMVRAGKQLGYVMADLKGMFFVKPDEGDLVEIHGKHRLREDMVRIGMGTSDIRFRAEYPTWNADITATSFTAGRTAVLARAGRLPARRARRPFPCMVCIGSRKSALAAVRCSAGVLRQITTSTLLRASGHQKHSLGSSPT
ncbi:hypothetical protein LCGC14_2370360, partial [marine sediment metagenome]